MVKPDSHESVPVPETWQVQVVRHLYPNTTIEVVGYGNMEQVTMELVRRFHEHDSLIKRLAHAEHQNQSLYTANRSLLSRLTRAEQDKERLDWLSDNADAFKHWSGEPDEQPHWEVTPELGETKYAATLREAIDSVMQAQEERP